MSFIAAASIAAGGSILGGLISSSAASKAAKAAADANLTQARETNAQNLKLFNLSRGAPDADGFGHSILPNYFGGNEQAFGQQAYDMFSRLSGLGGDAYGNVANYQSALRPSVNANVAALGNRFNGQDLAQRLAYSSPYFAARNQQASTYGAGLRDVASANSSAINTGLMQALGQLNAQRAGQGFLGSSTYDRNRMLSATLAARQAAAVQTAQAGAGANNAMAGANYANAEDTRGLQFGNLDFQSNSAVLPAAMSALTGFENSPAAALAQSFQQAQTPLNYFRIAPQAYQQAPLPGQDPQITNGQILGSAISQGSQTYGNMALMNRLFSSFGQAGANPYTSPYYTQSAGLAQQPSFLQGAQPFGGSAFGSAASPFNYSLGTPNYGLYPPPTG